MTLVRFNFTDLNGKAIQCTKLGGGSYGRFFRNRSDYVALQERGLSTYISYHDSKCEMLASASSFKGIQMNTKTGNETNMADARRAVVCSLIEGFTYDSMLEASRSED